MLLRTSADHIQIEVCTGKDAAEDQCRPQSECASLSLHLAGRLLTL
jgi:hypothetical protein